MEKSKEVCKGQELKQSEPKIQPSKPKREITDITNRQKKPAFIAALAEWLQLDFSRSNAMEIAASTDQLKLPWWQRSDGRSPHLGVNGISLGPHVC